MKTDFDGTGALIKFYSSFLQDTKLIYKAGNLFGILFGATIFFRNRDECYGRIASTSYDFYDRMQWQKFHQNSNCGKK